MNESAGSTSSGPLIAFNNSLQSLGTFSHISAWISVPRAAFGLVLIVGSKCPHFSFPGAALGLKSFRRVIGSIILMRPAVPPQENEEYRVYTKSGYSQPASNDSHCC